MWPTLLTPEQLALVRAFDSAQLEPVKDRKSVREFFRAVLASSFPDNPQLRTIEYLENHLSLRERAIRDLAKRLGELLDGHYHAPGSGSRSLTRLCLNTLDRGQPTEAEKNGRYRVTFETNERCHRFGLRNLFRPYFESVRGVAVVGSGQRSIGEALLAQTIEDALLAEGVACTHEARHRMPLPMKDSRDLILLGAFDTVEIPRELRVPGFADTPEQVGLLVTRIRTRRESAITLIQAASSEACEGFNGLMRSEAALSRFFDVIPSRRRILGNQFALLLSFPIDEDRELLSVEANCEDWAGIEEEPAPAAAKPVESEVVLPRHQIHKPARRIARS